MFADDIVTILQGAAVGTYGTTIFVGAKAILPANTPPFIAINVTGGTGPEGTHNLIVVPAYVRPSAQIVARAVQYADAEALAQAAYQAIFPVRNQFVNGVWWRSVTMLQEPFAMPEDAIGRPGIVFNFRCTKRLSSATS
jgi:hypothetical protein